MPAPDLRPKQNQAEAEQVLPQQEDPSSDKQIVEIKETKLIRTDVKAKLKESQRKWTDFLVENEQALQNVLAELSDRHNQYMMNLSGLHKNLQQDVSNLADLKSDLTRFICPSALATFEPLGHNTVEKFNLPKAGFTPVESPRTNAGGGNRSQEVLTETAFKDHLFMSMVPLYGLRDSLSDALIPLQEQVRRLEDYFIISAQRSSQLTPPQPELSDHSNIAALKNTSTSLSKEKNEKNGATGATASLASVVRDVTRSRAFPHVSDISAGKSRINFAVDILGGRGDESAHLLNSMRSFRIPGQVGLLISYIGVEPERTTLLAIFLASPLFEKLISLIIVANMVFITYASDYAVNNPFNQATTFIKLWEVTFQLLYAVELALKLIVHRAYFFVGEDWHWNCMDFILVATAGYDLYMNVTGQSWETETPSKSAFNLTFLRVLRLGRFSKVIRIFRVVRFVNELHVLLRAITSTLKSLFWCMLMLVVFFYIFAVVFVNATTAYLEDTSLDKANKADILDHWGSVSKAMISLYQATTGGKDWSSVSDTLVDVGTVYYSLFLFFIAFIILALLNILTGIFVEGAMKASAEDRDGEAISKLTLEKAIVTDLAKLHCVMSGQKVEENGTITLEQFETHMSSPALMARFSILGLEIWDTREFFSLLVAQDDSEEVSLETFVTGCMQMRGSAQRLEIQVLSSQVKQLTQMVAQFQSPSQNYGHTLSLPSLRMGGRW